jgi:sugar phosphate permease
MLYLHRYTFALIKPELAKKWNVELSTLGAMDSAFNAAYAVAQVPCGLLADLIGTHGFLTVAILVWSGALALHGWAGGPGAMFGVRVLFGVGQAGCYPSLSKVSRAWFPVASRTAMQGWSAVFCGRMGAASANLLFATVLIGWLGVDWRIALLLFSGAGLVLGVLYLIFFRSTPTQHPRVNEAERRLIEDGDAAAPASTPAAPSSRGAETASGSEPGTFVTLRRLRPAAVPNLVCMLVQQFASTFADQIYVAWVPYFLATEHKLKFAEMGIYSALPLIGGACGGAVGGYLNDYLIRRIRRRWARVMIGAGGKGLACLLVVGALLVYDDPYLFCWMLFFVKFFADSGLVTAWGAVTDVSGKATGTVFGVVNTVGTIGGVLSPTIFALVAARFNWGVVFAVVGSTYLLAALTWLLVNAERPLFDSAIRHQPDAQARE